MYDDFDDRDISLDEAIDVVYGTADIYDIPAGYTNAVTDMFEIIEIKRKHVKLQHLFNSKQFHPVELPNIILRSLSIGDIFLMTISVKDGCWGVSYISQLYETSDVPDDKSENV